MSGLAPSKSSHHLVGGGRGGGPLQRSSSEVVVARGFKPSDTRNPHKTKYLTDLSQKMWSRVLEAGGHKVNLGGDGPKKPIDLDKLFTPAPDAIEITPIKNKKVFASSSFYASDHPTVEEQVELARRISHSLVDISNSESKGQSMYENRKKRSVKWVHTAEGQNEEHSYTESSTEKVSTPAKGPKPALKLVMDPRGQIQDLYSLKKQGYSNEPAALSPDVCFDLVRDLNAPKGKGAELFAKRRKKAEKWIVDENNVKTMESYQSATSMASSTLTKLLPTPSYLEGATQKVENVQKMNQIQERFSQPRLKMVMSPWEAALEGSVESAFQEVNVPRGIILAPTPNTLTKLATPPPQLPPASQFPPASQLPPPQQQPQSQEDLCKPKAPRGWNPLHPAPTCKSFRQDSAPAGLSTMAPVSTPTMGFSAVNNFNTAPRGWQSSMSYYRPVTFQPPTPAFTDF